MKEQMTTQRPSIRHWALVIRHFPPALIATAGLMTACAPFTAAADRPDIRRLSQHFLDREGRTHPWMFVPKDNIASLSTSEHPGVVTIWEAGRGKDVKGLLAHPIRIGEYPLPWEFHLGLIQNYQAMKGIS